MRNLVKGKYDMCHLIVPQTADPRITIQVYLGNLLESFTLIATAAGK